MPWLKSKSIRDAFHVGHFSPVSLLEMAGAPVRQWGDKTHICVLRAEP